MYRDSQRESTTLNFSNTPLTVRNAAMKSFSWMGRILLIETSIKSVTSRIYASSRPLPRTGPIAASLHSTFKSDPEYISLRRSTSFTSSSLIFTFRSFSKILNISYRVASSGNGICASPHLRAPT